MKTLLRLWRSFFDVPTYEPIRPLTRYEFGDPNVYELRLRRAVFDRLWEAKHPPRRKAEVVPFHGRR